MLTLAYLLVFKVFWCVDFRERERERGGGGGSLCVEDMLGPPNIDRVTPPPLSLTHTTGQNIQDASEDGESLLSLACSAGYYELAEVLLRMRASVEDRGVKGQLAHV